MIRDRGAIKWHSAFFMPEHAKMLKQLKEDDKKQKKPQVDEQEFEEIGFIVINSLRNTYPIKLTLWDYGYFYDIIGTVVKVDMIEKIIMVETDLERKYIEIDKITRVKRL
ncbi:MAG TPA: YolD-like family protein [Pseudoneobacillus sp.]|nr:YolD-like family protein [Pseudoneobacillus sp.]